MSDRITISQLSIHLANGLGPSAFGLTPPPPCPILLDVVIYLKRHIIPLVANHDSMASLGVNYSSVSRLIYATLSPPGLKWAHAAEVMEAVAGCVLPLDSVDKVVITLSLPRAALHAEAIQYRASYNCRGRITDQKLEIRDLKAACIVGLHPHERQERQRLQVDLAVSGVRDWKSLDHKTIHDELHRELEQSSAGTLEALADQVSQHILADLPHGVTTSLTIRKPSALPFATPSIHITRSSADYDVPISQAAFTPLPVASGSGSSSSSRPRIFVALGSNIGDRMGNIRRAVRSLQSHGVQCVRTGRMYESEPMYVEDQARFANTVIEISSELEPLPLLRLLKKVERDTGRTKTFTNGPRVVDLDLLFYGDQVVKEGQRGDAEDESGVGWLELPHWGIAEREFVLRPLADMAPTFVHPLTRMPISVMLSRLENTLVPVIPTTSPLRLDPQSQVRPLIMAIFNATPDSFSDGSADRLDLPSALALIRDMLSSPHKPDILDIGGMSTRPGSVPCTEEEELQRVIPLIRAFRVDREWDDVTISIDTYRPAVARQAIEAGANMINDVRGGREPGMLATMADLGVPVVLMHSRGDSSTMTTPESQDYTAHGGVVQGVIAEMDAMVSQALEAGVKEWDIVLDPGIGFAKSPTQSIDLLRNLPELQNRAGRRYPMLVGASRKGFVGKVTGRQQADQRHWGDAVVNAHCAQSGAVDILRVHDWRGARESVQMAQALYPSSSSP